MTNTSKSRPIEILLVEDSPSDTTLTIEALRAGKIANRLVCVEDGVEAIAYLQQEGKYKNAVRPDLILLDLNLPRKDGREVLRELKNNRGFRMIPVVILTTSHAEKDVLAAYELQANCYITKPVDFRQFMDVVESIEQFWLTVVTLPPNP